MSKQSKREIIEDINRLREQGWVGVSYDVEHKCWHAWRDYELGGDRYTEFARGGLDSDGLPNDAELQQYATAIAAWTWHVKSHYSPREDGYDAVDVRDILQIAEVLATTGCQEQDKNKIHSADIEPADGYHYLIINGHQAARFDSMHKALAARELMLQPNEKEGPER
jgi:hypothetical protein